MPSRKEDPVLTSARREAWLTLGIWAISFLWTIGYCSQFGYNLTSAPELVYGIPSWILWGVITPWSLSTVASFIVSTFVMTDEDLGEDVEEPPSVIEAQREATHG